MIVIEVQHASGVWIAETWPQTTFPDRQVKRAHERIRQLQINYRHHYRQDPPPYRLAHYRRVSVIKEVKSVK